MLVKSSFEDWLKQFDIGLWIEEVDSDDIALLHHGKKRLCSVPKGLASSKSSWMDVINDKRDDKGYTTSDGIAHRSLSGVGLVLMGRGIISTEEFVKYFTSDRNKEMVKKILKSKMGLV